MPAAHYPQNRASEVTADTEFSFLLQFPVSSFGICLAISSQANLWKTIATSPSTSFFHVTQTPNLILWYFAVSTLAIITLIYSTKTLKHFESVKQEFRHPIHLNFFFAPWIALLLLGIGVPPTVAKALPGVLWYVLMAPIFCLELKIYGDWITGGGQSLSRKANPSNHLAIVGNFVGAWLGASLGLKEGALFFFAIGVVHYTVLFVTLYQKLESTESLGKELRPMFFLFVAAPSNASVAWEEIQGCYDNAARIAYFLALFLYVLLVIRVNFFRAPGFSMAWWAYTFPMTSAATATIRYSNEVKNLVTQSLCAILSAISTIVVMTILVMTIYRIVNDTLPHDDIEREDDEQK